MLVLESRPDIRLPQTKVPLVPIVGIASTDVVDIEGEKIPQDALDWSYFLRMGRITDNHGRSAGDVIGYPTKVEPITLPNGVKGTWIEGYLYGDDRTLPIIERMRASQAVGRPYGLSIEAGNAQYDETETPKRLIKADVINVALTPYPINPATFAAVMRSVLKKKGLDKSLAFGDPSSVKFEGGAALVPQDLGTRWLRHGGVAMGSINEEAVGKFLAGLSEEEKACLRKALTEEDTEGEPSGLTVADVLKEEKDEAEGLEKGVAEVAHGVDAVEIDVTEFLNNLNQAIQQGFGDLKALLEQVSRAVEKFTAAPQAAAIPEAVLSDISEIKGMLAKFGAEPVVKGVAHGLPGQPSVSQGKSPAVIKGLLLGKANDPSLDMKVRYGAAQLAAKVECGYMPTAVELATYGIS